MYHSYRSNIQYTDQYKNVTGKYCGVENGYYNKKQDDFFLFYTKSILKNTDFFTVAQYHRQLTGYK